MATLTVNERFWAKVVKNPNGCWEWTAHLTGGGYGQFGIGGKVVVYAHRFAYELMVGPIPYGLQIDHLCRVRSCVNPDHLEPVTPKVNSRRGETGKATGARNAAKTHCPQGHEYTEANTSIYRGSRNCRSCRRVRWRTKNGRAA